MENEKDYFCLEQNEKVFTKTADIEEDYSESLPAYCDDIFRVVKCSSNSFLSSVCINNGEVMLMGKTEIKLTYYNESSCLCYADFEEDFSRNIPVENLSENAFAFTDICNKYTNFRVINQRRIDVQISASVMLSVYDKTKCPCISSCEGAKLKKESINTANIIASNISKIEFDEEFTLPADCKPIKRIISSDCVASLTESKIIKDKVLIKAEVEASILYTSDNDCEEVFSASTTFNISKIIEQSGIDENDIIICNIKSGNIFHKAKSASGDKLCVAEIFGEISVNSVFIREGQCSFVTDGYMINADSNCSYSDFKAISNGISVNESKLFNLNVDLSSDIKEIKSISVNICPPVMRGSKLVSKADITVIYENESDALSSATSSAELSFDSRGREYGIAAITVKSADYTLGNSKRIDLRLGVDICAYFYDYSAYSLLSEIKEGAQKDKMPSLTVYYAKENESIWSIAKSFSSDSEMIISENELLSDIVDKDRILIIPRV